MVEAMFIKSSFSQMTEDDNAVENDCAGVLHLSSF